VASLSETNKHLQMPNADEMIRRSVISSTVIETGRNPLENTKSKPPARETLDQKLERLSRPRTDTHSGRRPQKDPIDFKDPEQVATFLLALSKGARADWVAWIEYEHGPNIVEYARQIGIERVAKAKADKAAKQAREPVETLPDLDPGKLDRGPADVAAQGVQTGLDL